MEHSVSGLAISCARLTLKNEDSSLSFTSMSCIRWLPTWWGWWLRRIWCWCAVRMVEVTAIWVKAMIKGLAKSAVTIKRNAIMIAGELTVNNFFLFFLLVNNGNGMIVMRNLPSEGLGWRWFGCDHGDSEHVRFRWHHPGHVDSDIIHAGKFLFWGWVGGWVRYELEYEIHKLGFFRSMPGSLSVWVGRMTSTKDVNHRGCHDLVIGRGSKLDTMTSKAQHHY